MDAAVARTFTFAIVGHRRAPRTPCPQGFRDPRADASDEPDEPGATIGAMPPSSRRTSARPATLRDVAELAGVSIKTVSNVVNDYPHVRPATREKVRAAITQVGYRPQAAARQLRTGASGLITLAVPSLRFSYFGEIAQAFVDEAKSRHLTVVLHSTSGGPEEERTVLDGFDSILGDGVIFNPLTLWETELATMERTSQPTVFIGEHVPETLPQGSDYVRIDNAAAARDITSHLLATGRRHLGFLGAIETAQGDQPHSSGTLRRDGFLQALREAGIDPTAAAVQGVSDWVRHQGREGVDALLARMPEVDGIVCGNDDLAIGALARLRERGIRVPEDIAVVGYDDTPDAAYASPPLTTIAPDKAELARTVMTLLSERIGGYDGPPRTITTPYHLMVRGSTPPRPRTPEADAS